MPYEIEVKKVYSRGKSKDEDKLQGKTHDGISHQLVKKKPLNIE